MTPKRIFTDEAIEAGDASILISAIGRAIIGLCGDRVEAMRQGDKTWEASSLHLTKSNENLRDRMMAETDAYEAAEQLQAARERYACAISDAQADAAAMGVCSADGGEPCGESEGD